MAAFFVVRGLRGDSNAINQKKATLPSAVELPSAVSSQPSAQNQTQTQTQTPTELNLKVPFTSQAPTGNWDHQHEEDCEEASMLMASRFLNNQTINGAADADAAMTQLVSWENQNLGVSDSITAEQTAETLSKMLNLKTKIIKNPVVEDIKNAISENKLVLVPAAGRMLSNPFYTAPGPLYHMLVIKGYTQTQFITNDPGTRQGENYPYGFNVILDANHDWNSGDVNNGSHTVIVVYK